MRHTRRSPAPCQPHPTRAAALLVALAVVAASPGRAQTALTGGYQTESFARRGVPALSGLALGLDTRIARGARWYLRFESLSSRDPDHEAELKTLSTGIQFGYFGPRAEAALGLGVGGYALMEPSESYVGLMADVGALWRVWLSGHVGLFVDLRLRSLDGTLRGGSAAAALGLALRLGR